MTSGVPPAIARPHAQPVPLWRLARREIRKIIGQTQFYHHFSHELAPRLLAEQAVTEQQQGLACYAFSLEDLRKPGRVYRRPFTWRFAFRKSMQDTLYEWRCWRKGIPA